MTHNGKKRKLAPEEASDWSDLTWENQRQHIFSTSLFKYQHSQMLGEQSLRRTVLIGNMMRKISLSECAEVAPPAGMEQLRDQYFVGPQQEKEDGHLSAGICDTVHAESLSPASVQLSGSQVAKNDEDWEFMLSDFEVETAINSILFSLESPIDGSPQAVTRSPLRPVENLSEEDASWEKSTNWKEAQGDDVEALRSRYFNDITMVDLSQNIDTSVMDRDVEVLAVQSGGDDFLHHLPSLNPVTDSFAISLNPSQKWLPAFSSFIPPSLSSSIKLEHLM